MSNWIFDRFLRRISVRARVIGSFMLIMLFAGSIAPVILFSLNSLAKRLEQVTNVDAEIERLLLTSSRHVTASQLNLNHYIQGIAASPFKVLDDTNLALQDLEKAKNLITDHGQIQSIGIVIGSLQLYRQGIVDLQKAYIARDNIEVARLQIQLQQLGGNTSARLELMASDNAKQVATTNKEVLNDAQQSIVIGFSLVIVGFFLAIIFSVLTSISITRPLAELRTGAETFQKGDMTSRINVTGTDELTVIARIFNDMTKQIGGLITGLETRVAERTTDLEIARQQSERRARELQTIGEISGTIASEQKTETLLPLVTRVVSKRFDFYHVGIFLVDETGQWAVLQAANSEGGQSMLARRHKLEVGATGIVGYVTKNGTARIALDVGVDSVFFNNPDLPATRSEIALPLNVRGQIIGALDVQSTRPGAFTEDDANTLGILADQIAIAIENTRLFGRIQSTLAEVQSLYRQDIATSWAKFAQDEGVVGYHKSLTESKLINQAVDTDEIRQTMNRGSVSVFNADKKRTESTLVVPVKLRGQVIGVLNIKASKNEHQWSFDEIGLAEVISERLALALENARLLQDSQNRAAKEQAISEITTKISGSINMRNILQTAVEELGHALPGSEVIIEFEQKNGNVE